MRWIGTLLVLALLAGAASAGLIDRYTLSRDNTFIQRVEQAVVEVAVTVLRETPTAAYHVRRIALAKRVLAESAPFGVIFAAALASVPSIATAAGVPANQANVTDAQIVAVVTAGWDDLAGARE